MASLENIRTVAKRVLPAGETTRALPVGLGRGLRLGIDFHGGHVGLYLGLYECELNSHLRRLCARAQGSFDLGGQIGYDALVIAKLSRARVVSVECSADWCKVIRKNVAENPAYSSQILVENAFVTGPVADATRSITIDDLADRHFVPDFIKMDIEGGEVDALKGATQVLSSRKPDLLIEVHARQLESECLRIIEGYGYRPKILNQRRWLRDHRPAQHNRWIVAQGRA